MRSNAQSNSSELELHFPGTEADSAALERARDLNVMSPRAYLEFLLTFAPFHPPGRELPPHDEPFRL
jgi:hypothetical protein